MKKIATFMFLLAVAGSLAAWPFRDNFIGGLIFAACEAALVGALADWFAVVALFRHPLGLKFIPHTAIIPNNRSRIIEGIISIVEKDWLSQDFIKAKIFDYQLIDGLAAALETEDGRRELNRIAQSVVTNTVQEISPEDAAHFLQTMLKENLAEIRIPPRLIEQAEEGVKKLYTDDLIKLLLNWAIAATRGDEFEKIIKRTITRAADDYSNQGSFLRRLGKGLGEGLDIVNYDDASRALSHRINRILTEMMEPDNRFHVKLRTELQNLKLADPDAASDMITNMLKNAVGNENGSNLLREFLTLCKDQLLSGDSQDMPLVRFLTKATTEQINVIRRDEERKTNLEARIKTELASLLERYHGVIGKIVREKLESLDDTGLVMSLEAKVGDDLQWIRINGTVIGAMVGVLQYLILRLI